VGNVSKYDQSNWIGAGDEMPAYGVIPAKLVCGAASVSRRHMTRIRRRHLRSRITLELFSMRPAS